jgi:hypothetical protein
MIHVQVQPERAKRLDIAAANESLRRLAKNRTLVRRFKFEEGSDNGSYMNFNYLTTRPTDLWEALRSGPLRSRLLRSAAMVVCEGANGWDDYLLLHHWDRRLKLDAVPANSNNAFKGRRAKRARPQRER